MSRVTDTWGTIEETKTALIGDVKKPELYMIPLLSQIALSLAVIADKLTEDEDKP